MEGQMKYVFACLLIPTVQVVFLIAFAIAALYFFAIAALYFGVTTLLDRMKQEETSS